MYRNRNLDIAIAAIVAILGGLAAVKHLPGQVTIPLGVGLFFAPGYLWSEAILSHHLPGFERAMVSAGMAFIFPILGGFLFYGLHIPLFESSWVGLLVVLTLLGVVATAIQRLRQVPDDQEYQQPRRTPPQQPRQGNSVVLHSFVFGLAALIGIGAIGYSVKSADAQKFPGYTDIYMTQVVNNSLAKNTAALSDNQNAQNLAAEEQDKLMAAAKQAHLGVTNHMGVPEQYEVKLLDNGKVVHTWPISLSDGQTWQKTIAWTMNSSMLADLYQLPNTSTPIRHVDNGVCVTNLKALPAVLQPEDPCYKKT